MRGFLQKAKAELKGVIQQQESGANYPGSSPTNCAGNQQANQIGTPSPEDIIRYRYHHGTNVGSVFVIERWLQPSRFPDGAEGSSELACVKAWVDRIGIEATRQKFEEQWLALTDDDINYLRHANCTTIRLPIGYFDLPGEEFTRGTPFEPYAGVYAAAWPKIEDLVRRLRWSGIGVLVDLHALPGGANGQEHSGTNSGKAELWTSPFNRALGVRCGQFLAQSALQGLLAGIQLVNEAEWDAPGMYEWYDECIAAISAVDPSIPVIISDGWNLDRAIDYTLQKNKVEADRVAPVVIDTHYYWAFTDEDKQKSPQQITEEARHKLSNLDGKEGSVIDRGAVQVIVGEYSCVMTEDSWAKLGSMSREEGVRNFGNAQSQRWQQRSGGSFFWTYKMDWMPGGEWGFKAQTDLGSITPPKLATRPRQELQALFDKARGEQDWRGREALRQHVDYWNGVDPGGYYEHDKYEFGWKVGYQDATAFFWGLGSIAGSTNDGPYGARIGMLEVWILKRIRESGFRGGFTWEFEQGLRRGVQDFYSAVEV